MLLFLYIKCNVVNMKKDMKFKKYTFWFSFKILYLFCLFTEDVVNAVLLKLHLELCHSRYNPSALNVNPDTNSSAVNVKPTDTILLALNVNTDTSIAVKQALSRQYQISRHNLSSYVSIRTKLQYCNQRRVSINWCISSSYTYLQYNADI